MIAHGVPSIPRPLGPRMIWSDLLTSLLIGSLSTRYTRLTPPSDDLAVALRSAHGSQTIAPPLHFSLALKPPLLQSSSLKIDVSVFPVSLVTLSDP